MWAAIKLLPMGLKVGAVAVLLLSLVGMWFTTKTIYYNKGVAVSAVVIADYKAKVANLNTKLTEKNAQVAILESVNLQKKKAEIRVTGAGNQTIIVNKIPSQFNFSNGWIAAYNASVQGQNIDVSLAVDPTKSKVTDVYGLSTIASNNEICLSNAAQLQALINYINGVSKNAKDINAK